jgi:hypothetical protein
MFCLGFRIDIDRSMVPQWNQRDFFCPHGSFKWWPHKHWEIQFSRWPTDVLVKAEFDLRFRGSDHAGPSIYLEVLGLMFHAQIYDDRHWNHDANRWSLPEDDDEHDGGDDERDVNQASTG